MFYDSASLGEPEVSELHLGQWVEFDVQYGAARTRAIHIRRLPAGHRYARH